MELLELNIMLPEQLVTLEQTSPLKVETISHNVLTRKNWERKSHKQGEQHKTETVKGRSGWVQIQYICL